MQKYIQRDTDYKNDLHIGGDIASNSKILFSVSINEPEQSGQDFYEMVKLVLENESIDSGILLITDTLQRHTLKMKEIISDESALSNSVKLGDTWLKNNEDAINLLLENKNFEIKRWSELTGDYKDELEEKLNLILDFYSSNKEFRDNVNSRAGQAVKKIKTDLKYSGENIPGKLFENAKSYILEECAMRIVLGNTLQCDYEIYKTQLSKAMRLAYKEYGVPIYMKEVNIRSSKKSLPNVVKESDQSNAAFIKRPDQTHQDPIVALVAFYLNSYKLTEQPDLYFNFASELVEFMNEFINNNQSNTTNSNIGLKMQ